MRRAILAVCLLVLSAGPAWTQTYSGDTDAITNQRDGQTPCDTTGNLPVGVYSLVGSNSSFEPCHQAQALGQGGPGENCDSTYQPLDLGHRRTWSSDIRPAELRHDSYAS